MFQILSTYASSESENDVMRVLRTTAMVRHGDSSFELQLEVSLWSVLVRNSCPQVSVSFCCSEL